MGLVGRKNYTPARLGWIAALGVVLAGAAGIAGYRYWDDIRLYARRIKSKIWFRIG